MKINPIKIQHLHPEQRLQVIHAITQLQYNYGTVTSCFGCNALIRYIIDASHPYFNTADAAAPYGVNSNRTAIGRLLNAGLNKLEYSDSIGLLTDN